MWTNEVHGMQCDTSKYDTCSSVICVCQSTYYHGNQISAQIFRDNLVQYHWELPNWNNVLWTWMRAELTATCATKHSSTLKVQHVHSVHHLKSTTREYPNHHYPNCWIGCSDPQARRLRGHKISCTLTTPCGGARRLFSWHKSQTKLMQWIMESSLP
jgi:hypothetical protein